MADIEINLTPTHSPLELAYRNGGEITTTPYFPVFRDILFTQHSQEDIESVLRQAKQLDKPIRSDPELNKCITVRALLEWFKKECKRLEKIAREPWKNILSQISIPIATEANKIEKAEGDLRRRIEDYRTLQIDGARIEEERLKEKAVEKRQEAKYADNPQRRRAAQHEAKQLELEAKEISPKPLQGIDTEEYFEFEINSRVEAARYPEEAVEMRLNQQWFKKALKEKQAAGVQIHSAIFPGITVNRKVRTRFHK